MHNLANAATFMKETGFRQFPAPGEQGAFSFTHKLPLFDFLRENPDVKQNFDGYMGARRQGIKEQWHETYPASTTSVEAIKGNPEAALILDVGGGAGHDLVSFKKSHPELPGRFILQDLPETLDAITEPLDGIEKMPYDFFTPQPVKGWSIFIVLSR